VPSAARKQNETPWPGLSFARLPGSGIPVLTVHYSARPDMTPERVETERAGYPSEAFWQREMEIDAHALSGQLVYPDFDENTHVVPGDVMKDVGRVCRYMAIDPHIRTPHAFLWLAVDRWDDLWIYREMWPSKAYAGKSLRDTDEEYGPFSIREYADRVAREERNEIEWYNAEQGDREYGLYRQKPSGERIIYRFMDQAGKGFRASDESQPSESFSGRYAKYGIQCQDPIKSHGLGEDAIREALEPRWNTLLEAMWPRLHILAGCRELIWEFRNLRYQSTKTSNDERELKQMPVQARSHMLDLLRYLLASGRCAYIESLAS
jgi:hypothetical protein